MNIIRLKQMLSGRLARNVYFWAIPIFLRLQYAEFRYTGLESVYCSGLLLLLMVLLYANNLVFIPGLLAQKKTIRYFLATGAAIVFASTVSTYVIIDALQRFPRLSAYKIVWIPLGRDGLAEIEIVVFIHLLIYSLLVLVFSLCWYLGDYRKKQKELAEIKVKQEEMELAFLRNQLNPHFLFNTLNNVYGLALEKKENTADSILKLSQILRYLTYESGLAVVPLEKEKEIMHAYIELELLRLSDTNNVTFFITTDKVYHIPPLLWMPVLENVFKHGTRFISDELNIEYRCTAIDNKLTIFSKNTFKPGMKQDGEGSGIGMTTLKKRLQLLYPDKHSINMKAEGNIYTTNIEINLI